MFDPVAKTKILLNMYLLEMKNVTVDQCLAVHERPISIKHKNKKQIKQKKRNFVFLR